MMPKIHLPAASKRFAEQAFAEKEKWHQRRARMSFTRKIEALDRLLEASKTLPELDNSPEP